MIAAVAGFLIKSSLILLPVLAISHCRRFSAAERHALTLVALLGLPLMASIDGLLDWRIPLLAPETSQAVPAEVRREPLEPAIRGELRSPEASFARPRPRPQTQQAAAGTVARDSAVPAYLTLAYLLVAGVLGLRALLSWWHIARHVRTLPNIDLASWALDLPPRTLLCWSDCASPWTWGIRRPVVVLPREFVRWPPRKQLHALAHEIAHVHRRDSLTQTIGHALTILFWFQPLAWMLRRRLGRLAEQASDDRVLGLGVAAPDYAQWLVDVARAGNRGTATGLAMSRHPRLAMSRHPLQHRIDAILDPSTRRIPMKVRNFLAMALLAVGAAAPMAALTLEPALPDQRNYLPVLKVAPVYPRDAQDRHIEGYAVLEFEVTEHGTTTDVRVVEESPPGVFGQSAVAAARTFLYLPAREHGRNVSVPGVRNRITYELAKGADGTIENKVSVDWEAARSSLERTLAAPGELAVEALQQAVSAAQAERRRNQRLLSAVIERAEAAAERTGSGDLYLQAASLATSLQETGHAIHCLLRASNLAVSEPASLKIELAQLLLSAGRLADAKALFANQAAGDELSGQWLEYLEKEGQRRAAVYQALSSELRPMVSDLTLVP